MEQKFYDLGSKTNHIKYPRQSFCRLSNFKSFGIFQLHVTLKLHITVAVKHLPFFNQNGERCRHYNAFSQIFYRRTFINF